MKPSSRRRRMLVLSVLTLAALWAHAKAPAGPMRWFDAMARSWTATPADMPEGCRNDDEAWTH